MVIGGGKVVYCWCVHGWRRGGELGLEDGDNTVSQSSELKVNRRPSTWHHSSYPFLSLSLFLCSGVGRGREGRKR